MHKDNFELVSVVIPTHNRLSLLKDAIATVRAQSWPNWEIIIVNDNSTDATASFLKSESEIDQRIKFINNSKSLGGAGSRNAGLEFALGPYISFLDDDDLWAPDKMEIQVNLLKARKDASAVSCSFSEEYPSGKKKVRLVQPLTSDQEILKSNKLGGASMCLALKSTLDEVGGFDSRLRSGQDWDLWIKLNRKGPILVCADPLVRHLFHEGERITTNPKSVYLGRRRMYFKNKKQLAPATGQHQLWDLAYLRIVALANSRILRLRGLWRISKITNLYYGAKCIRRLFILELDELKARVK
jgi:glycosyltransferase involved in cell wall biosynthesis